MNSRERVFGTIQGESVDQRPFVAVLSLYGARMIGCPLAKYYRDAKEYGRAQALVRETFAPDIITSPFSLSAFGEIFGGELQFYDDRAPNLLHPAISSAAEISSLTVPDLDTTPFVTYVREGLEHVVADHGSDAAIASILLSPIEMPMMIMGVENWMMTVLTDKDGVQRMLDITTPFFIEYANALFEGGSDLIVLPSAFLTPAISTRKMVEEFAIPVLREVYAQVNGPLILHNTGSRFMEFLDLFVGLPNVAGFVMDVEDDYVQARDIMVPEAIIFGGADGLMLKQESVGNVRASLRQTLENVRGDRRFILSTSGPDVPLSTPPENIHALREAVEEFGAT
jgi:uroporphyrinogen decarboxylase